MSKLHRLKQMEYDVYKAYMGCPDILLEEYGLMLLFKGLMDGLDTVIKREELDEKEFK